MTEEQARESAGRLLLRYGWPATARAEERFPSTDRQSTRNRIMNDPDSQAEALKALESVDNDGAEQLIGLCHARRNGDASLYARALVTQHETTAPAGRRKKPAVEETRKT
jgi:hypothetical protein